MAFVSEYISDEDIKKYDIEALNKKFNLANYQPMWTINENKDVYIRYHRRGREEFAGHLHYYMYWKGLLIKFEVTIVDSKGHRKADLWYRYELVSLDLPQENNQFKPEIISDIKEALIAYKDLGVISDCQSFSADFNF